MTAGTRLATTIEGSGKKVDIALVHDPAMAAPLSGVVPLVLAGHRHKREVSILPEPTPAPLASATSAGAASPVAASPSTPTGATQAPMRTRLMIEGSTGGAGLRGLEGEDPTPLALSVLYFDENHQLKAYDDIQLGGTGESNIEMQRNVISAEPEGSPRPSASTTPQPQPSG